MREELQRRDDVVNRQMALLVAIEIRRLLHAGKTREHQTVTQTHSVYEEVLAQIQSCRLSDDINHVATVYTQEEKTKVLCFSNLNNPVPEAEPTS